MKINSSENYLNLIVGALDISIIPELNSASSRGAAEIVRATLIELVKRQSLSLPALRDSVIQGEALARAMQLFMGTPAEVLEPVVHAESEGFDALALQHAALTQRINDLCNKLVALGQKAVLHAADEVRADLLLRGAQWETSYYTRQAQISPAPTVPEETAGAPLSREFLQKFLNERRSADEVPVEVTSFEPVLGGFGKQTFLCRAKELFSSLEWDLVVRKTDPKPIMMHGFSILEQEYHLLRSLAKTGFPAPRPRHLASNVPGVDGSFYTMDRISGRVLGSFLGGMNRTYSEHLYLQLAELMATLHRIPIETFGDYLREHGDEVFLTANVGDCYRRNIAGWRRYAAETPHLPSPFLGWLFDWLDRHAPQDSRRPVLVHGDFNVHNMLEEDGKITGVLDWECADFGAPEQDLAYIRPHIEKHISWQRFLDHYHSSGGPEIDPNLMHYCMAYAAVRVNLAGNRGSLNLQQGVNRDIRYAMVELGFAQAFMQMALGSALLQ